MQDEHRHVYHKWPQPGTLDEDQCKDFRYDITKHRRRVYSQHGEEGALERLFEILKIKIGWCCEFGAADGKWFSNTLHLIERGWQGVMIESDEEKFKLLKDTQSKHPENLIIMWETIGYGEGGVLLDVALARTPIPEDFDVLSIDCDGPDYHIWKALENYRPKIVIIEQSGIPGYHINVEGVGRDDPRRTTSFQPLKELGESKGYTLVALLGNMIFVADEYIP